ncbi:helix-turn-helix domain-containing protein [Nocardia crassostreae]|uniref:helix-turn-helix domain-containing protein n=1 Tax=Nocardia crassostreae TaxID=53428 RepID=UPI00082BEC53|nr:helix-turn-helix domain-containing protein [Nocardia crassostreae]
MREALLCHGVAAQREIAAALSMSVLTLRRRLAAEGTTFKQLSDDTLGALAAELLLEGASVRHVAERLGYSSSSALSVAFKSWTGQSPSAYVRERRG